VQEEEAEVEVEKAGANGQAGAEISTQSRPLKPGRHKEHPVHGRRYTCRFPNENDAKQHQKTSYPPACSRIPIPSQQMRSARTYS
jgi:hypothetical protein